MDTQDAVRYRFQATDQHHDERQRRLAAAAEARTAGYGGIAAVARATGIAPSTIGRGLKDLDDPAPLTGAVRRPGAGRRPVEETQPGLLPALARLVEPATLGDPMRPLLWVSKSLVKLAVELTAKGYKVGPTTMGRLLEKLDFRRQANRKTREGAHHPDRDAQFQHINAEASAFLASAEPVISVDTKKKELVGDFKNAGTDYRPSKCPDGVRVHDFVDKELGKAIPHGVYDIGANAGWVSVGIDHDTAEFAAHSIGRWWETMGQPRYPGATRLLITCDGGGSNGYRTHLWKIELQKLADATGLAITVCHYPPDTSKWNKIEHRLFSHITQNWRGKPLLSRLAIVELIASTTTSKGLTVRCELDPGEYETGKKVLPSDLAVLNIERNAFHPEWNYTIRPGACASDRMAH